jgi:DNA polymerase III subunit epsilon
MLGWFLGRRGAAPGINERMPLAQASFAIIDTELTGLDGKRDSILSIGAVRMRSGKIEIGDAFVRLVSPETVMKAENVVIHEITPSDVAAKPAIDTVLPEFLAFCGDAVLVGHMIAIDMEFLDRDARRVTGKPVPNARIDTFSVYTWLRKKLKTYPCLSASLPSTGLYDVARCFGVPVEGAHNALMDAFMTAQIFQRFIPMLQTAGARDLGDLLKIGIPFEGGDIDKLTGEISNF